MSRGTMSSRMNKIFRTIFLDVLKDGTPEERQGRITRSRFNRSCSRAMDFLNEPRRTDPYWAQAQKDRVITILRPDPLSGQLQYYEHAVVDPEVWASDGFILKEGEQLQQVLKDAVKVESAGRAKRQKVGVMTPEELV
jgi:hypothetical protein